MRMYTIRAIAVVLVVGCSAAAGGIAQKKSWRDRELAGRVAGPAADCIFTSRTEGPMIVDRQTILFREGGRRIWRADLGDSCPSLREDMILLIRPRDSRLCRDDRFQPLDRDSRIPGAVCRFGRFVPYDRR
ncbi:hypothetical protein [Sphingomonas sp. Leaf412]|uniref:hypothetical protein n=1 Tax=Sphingomonas sp. Leaf412 TaxID=1736370 RepID=UPI000AD4D83F|nr:hypothetical protein [Sphingomonas sp. Leaf412]